MKVRSPTKRVILNRKAFDAIKLGEADGAQAIGERIIARAEPSVPDRPPFGKGLVETGAVATYLDGKLVAGRGRPGGSSIPKNGVVTHFGFGFPGDFLERGTVYITPRPFLTPAAVAEVPDAGPLVAESIGKRLRNA